jgi:hypothetical protein
MIRNIRRLIVLHLALGLASIITYAARPGAFAPPGHSRGWNIALAALLKVLLAWTPYFISGYYSCEALASRDPKATLAFIYIAIGVTLIASALNLNLFRMSSPAAPLVVFGGVTIVLLASARLCAAIWRHDVSGWDSRL